MGARRFLDQKNRDAPGFRFVRPGKKTCSPPRPSGLKERRPLHSLSPSASPWAPPIQRPLQRPEPPTDVHLRLRPDARRVQPRWLSRLRQRAQPSARRMLPAYRPADLRRLRRQVRRHCAGRTHTQGFDLVAWIAPFAVFAAALLGTILLVRHWADRQKPRRPPQTWPIPKWTRLRERIRRETGNEGGY